LARGQDRFVNVSQAEPALTDVTQLDRLIRSLERADEAIGSSSTEDGDAALAEALQTLGTLYGSLSLDVSPEAAAHLESAYDACIRALGDAYGGSRGALVPAIVVVRSIRAALMCENASVSRAA
jgi:flagellin-specific chaperone FliS